MLCLLIPGAPQFIEEPNSSYHYINRAEGQFITLPCRAYGIPEPVIRWYRSGIEEIDIGSANSSFLLSGGSLLIPVGKQIQNEVSTYHCTASNKLGTIRSASTIIRPAFIDAFRKSRLDAYPLTVKGGGTRLDCQAPVHYPSKFCSKCLHRYVCVHDMNYMDRSCDFFLFSAHCLLRMTTTTRVITLFVHICEAKKQTQITVLLAACDANPRLAEDFSCTCFVFCIRCSYSI